ncbi:MAG TPA: adenosine deaminase [Nocardioidaceae bacterium]|nr:adenosine deaminase [Nocardioidaceae bacterium]
MNSDDSSAGPSAQPLAGPASAAQPVAEFVAGLPKAELHVHLVGSASVPTVLELARRHPDLGVPTEQQTLRAFYEFTDFAHFIEVYIAVNSLVRTESDVEALIRGVAGDLADQQVRYAELTVTPDSHLLLGIEPDAVAEALTRARAAAAREYGVELAWIFDIPGELGLESGLRTIDWVERWAPEGSVGFGLGGPEVGVPRPQFEEVFARARALGLHSVPHAGETTGPETVWDALRVLGAERIGHGITAAQDPALVTHLAEQQIPLEVCPTSNVRTRAVASLDAHPMPALMAAGVPVSLNSDDPGMFSTTLCGEYAVAHEVFGIDAAGLADLSRAAVRASYAPEPTRRRLLTEIDAYERG